MEFEIVESKRGKPVILYLGYRLTLNKVYQNENKRWTCSTRTCPGNITTDSQISTILKTSDHTCEPNIAKNEVEMCIAKTKKRAREEHTAIPQIYRQEMISVKDRGLDFVTQIPSFVSVKHSLYNARHSALGIHALPSRRQDIIIPDKFKDFVLLDDGAEDRILAFSEDAVLLNQGTCFFGDGTFKSCCPLFDQLYTIHMDVGSTNETTNVVPVVYALLPDRKQNTYFRLFRLLKDKMPQFNPQEFHIDFETAAINALTTVFSNVEIKGCNFHFNQAIWRKVQELGLTQLYRGEKEIRDHIKMCAALAHLPPDYIEDGFLHIMETTPTIEAIVQFNDYFVSQWIENDRFWVCYNERHRTTNTVEGWHNRLNRKIGKHHPNFYELLTALREEAEYYKIVVQQIDQHMPVPKRKKNIKIWIKEYSRPSKIFWMVVRQ